jgi:hypothetical protein
MRNLHAVSQLFKDLESVVGVALLAVKPGASGVASEDLIVDG